MAASTRVTSWLPLALARGAARRRDVLDQARDGKVGDLQFHLVGFDPRDVEDVGDERQQVLAGRGDPREIFFSPGVARQFCVFLQNLAVTNDGVERRSQFMAHLGEKDRLVAARPLGLVLRVGELFGCPAMPLGLALQSRFGRQEAAIVDRQPSHVESRAGDGHDADVGHLLHRNADGKISARPPNRDERRDIHDEDRQYGPRPVAEVEKAIGERDQQPRQKRRADAAVVVYPEQSHRDQRLNRDDRDQGEIACRLQQGEKQPEARYSDRDQGDVEARRRVDHEEKGDDRRAAGGSD